MIKENKAMNARLEISILTILKKSCSQSATIPEQPTTSGHDEVQLSKDRNKRSTQKNSQQSSASENHKA